MHTSFIVIALPGILPSKLWNFLAASSRISVYLIEISTCRSFENDDCQFHANFNPEKLSFIQSVKTERLPIRLTSGFEVASSRQPAWMYGCLSFSMNCLSNFSLKDRSFFWSRYIGNNLPFRISNLSISMVSS